MFRRVPTLTFECPQGGSYSLPTGHSPELHAIKTQEKMFFVDDFVIAKLKADRKLVELRVLAALRQDTA